MPRIKKPKKVKEPIRLRMKDLSDGSKSLYLDIYRNGKRTYEYLKLYLIPGTDSNTRRQNEITMAAANAIKSKRIIELTSGEAGIVNHTDKIYGEFYQFNLSSCIRQQNSLTAQFVSFSLANLANIFYPPQFLQ